MTPPGRPKKSSQSSGKRRRTGSATPGDSPPRPAAAPRLDLSKIRHDLRTPINHILGYCELLQEDEKLPAGFAPDLARIHAGGRQMLALIAEYFDEETFETKRGDVHRLCHDLRTPVNQIIGYSEMLQESAEESGRKKILPDLRKIRDAAESWLALMEEYLLPAGNEGGGRSALPGHMGEAGLLAPGITYQSPAARSPGRERTADSRLLVVDDDASNRDMLSRRLRRDGYSLQVAANGVEALQLLRTSPVDLVLLDLIMPGLDGYQVLVKMKSEPALQEIPVIMISALDQEDGIARCIELGAEDYVSKPFSPVFLRARLEACLEKKRLHEREQATHQALVASQKRLTAELAEAGGYVRSLLPEPLEGDIQVQWRFRPCAELGGDIMGYHWLNPDELAIYLLDVSGHGVGSALLSVSVLNVLRAQSLPETDFRDPAAVLGQLNRLFPMERHNNLLFTMWYGVYQRSTRQLTYASGGHPPAVLIEPSASDLQTLTTAGPLLGCNPDARYSNASCAVGQGSRVYVYSDGAYEIERPDGSTAQMEDLFAQLREPVPGDGSKLDALMSWAEALGKRTSFEDDVSVLEVSF